MALGIAFYYNYVPTFQQSMFLCQIVDKCCHDWMICHIFCNFLSPKTSGRIRTLHLCIISQLFYRGATANLLPPSIQYFHNFIFLGGGGAFLTWFEFKHVCSLYRWTTISVIDMALVIAFYYNCIPTFKQSMFLSQIVDKSCHDWTIRHILFNFLSLKKPAAGFEPFIFGIWVSCSTTLPLPTCCHLQSNIFIFSFFFGGGRHF